MFTSRPEPHRPRVEQITTVLVATCLILLAISTGAAARTPQPTATISSAALHGAIAARTAAERAFIRSSSKLRTCLRTAPKRCSAERRAVRHSRIKLTGAERRVHSLTASIARRRHASPSTTGAQAPISPLSGHSTGSSPTSAGSVGPVGIGSIRTGSAGTGPIGTRPAESGPADTGSISTGSGSEGTSSGDFGQSFVKGVDTNLQGWGATAEPQVTHEITTLGAHWAREDLNWSKVEPQRGVFDWSAFDQMVATAQANGITILPVIGYAPSWTTPSSSADYAAFVAAAVARYGPGTASNLQWWELWNEPYYAYAWSGQPGDPAAYARDVRAASQAAKEVAPTVKVLMAAEDGDAAAAGGGWWTTSVQAYFAAVPDLGKWIDGVAVHPYGDDPALPVKEAGGFRDASGGWSFQRIDSIRASFAAHGVNVPFWITEIGWSTAEMSEATQAHNYEDLIAQVSARPWIRAMFTYCMREFNNNPADAEAQFGLEKYGTWQPKQAFYALQKGFGALS
jgi:hypothetical protein